MPKRPDNGEPGEGFKHRNKGNLSLKTRAICSKLLSEWAEELKIITVMFFFTWLHGAILFERHGRNGEQNTLSNW